MAITNTFSEFSGAEMETSFGASVTGITFDDKQGSIIFGEDIDEMPESFAVTISFIGTYGLFWCTELFVHMENVVSARYNKVYQFTRVRS